MILAVWGSMFLAGGYRSHFSFIMQQDHFESEGRSWLTIY